MMADEGSGAGGSEYAGGTPCMILVLLYRSTRGGVDAPSEPRCKSLLQPLVYADMSDTSHTSHNGFTFNMNSLIDQPDATGQVKELVRRTDEISTNAVKYKLTIKGRDVRSAPRAPQTTPQTTLQNL